MYVIEKNIPMPLGYVSTVWPFRDMEVGDSFAVPPAKRAAAGSAAFIHSKKHNKKFAIRKQPDGSYRVWRTA